MYWNGDLSGFGVRMNAETRVRARSLLFDHHRVNVQFEYAHTLG